MDRLPAGVRTAFADGYTDADSLVGATTGADHRPRRIRNAARAHDTCAVAAMHRVVASATSATSTLAAVAAERGTHLLYTSSTLVYCNHDDEWVRPDAAERPAPFGRGHARVADTLLARHRRKAHRSP